MNSTGRQGQLGTFLHARRSQLSPEDVGLSRYGERRRVPGLRREELAQLAGVSISYYTRLEQGQSLNASPEVLDAIARALLLDDDEHRHLRELASVGKRRDPARRPPTEHVTPALRELLAHMGDVPAIVLGRRLDVLAWNSLGHALLAGHMDPSGPDRPADRPNMARMIFLDAHNRDLYLDWPGKARVIVGSLRLIVGQHPQDTLLAALIGELSMKSPDFAALWADHRVRACDTVRFTLRHPLVGGLTVTQQTLVAGQPHGQMLVAVTTEPGSPSAAAIVLLRSFDGLDGRLALFSDQAAS